MPGLSFLAEAGWLTPRRARGYAVLLLATTLIMAVLVVGSSHGGVDWMRHPLGTDFLSFWAASDLALHGDPAGAYNPLRLGPREAALFADYAAAGYSAFLYPPTYLLLCLPFALLPYLWSLAAWLGLTFAAYWHAMRALLPGRALAVPIIAFPGVLVTAGHGQNALLTTALFAGAARLLPTRPALAGLCLGALCFKPHLLLLAPVMLLAGRHWRAIAAATATAAALLAATLLVFGPETWRAYLLVGQIARRVLTGELFDPAKMASVFAACRVLGAPIPLAAGMQALAALAAAAALLWTCRGKPASGQIAALVAATTLATPYLLDYDLTLGAVPIAYVFSRAQAEGFLRWEKLVLVGAFLVPLLARPVALKFSLPLAPLVEAALLALVLRRLRRGG
jgi:hypothetical protein